MASNVEVEIVWPQHVFGNSSFKIPTLAANSTYGLTTELFVNQGYLQPALNAVLKISASNAAEYKTTISVSFEQNTVKTYAYILTTSNYSDNKTWGALPNANAAGLKLKEILQNDYQVEKIVHKNNLSTDDFTGFLKDMKNVDENDQLFIYIAGHGHFDADFRTGYLVFNNTAGLNTTSMYNHAQLAQILEHIPSKHIFLVIDACYSSTFDFEVVNAMLAGNLRGRETKSMEQYMKDELKLKSRLYLTSGETQTGTGSSQSTYSPFSSAIIQALQNTLYRNDGVVNYYELRFDLEQRKLNPTPRGAHFGSNETGSNFLFILK